MSDLVNHTTQGKAFWYPESAQGTWMNGMGMGMPVDPAKTTLVTNTSPIKPRPPPRCFRNVPRKERPLREILEVRLHPRREFGKKRRGATSFGSKFPSKSRVGNQTHFEVPGPGSYRLPEATGGKHAPQVSIGLSDRPNYFKDLQKRAAESPAPKFQFKPLELGPCPVHYRSVFTEHKEPDLSPGPGSYMCGPSKAATDAIPPPGAFIKGAVFDRTPRFKDRIRMHDSEEERIRKMKMHDYVSENVKNVETSTKKIEKITKFSNKVSMRVARAKERRAQKEIDHYNRSVSLAAKHVFTMNRRRVCFALRVVVLGAAQSYLRQQLEHRRRQIFNEKIERAEKYYEMKIFQTWWRSAKQQRKNRMAVVITCAIRQYIFRKKLKQKIWGANVIRRTLHAEQGMDRALMNIRKFRVKVLIIQRFLKKVKIANEGRIEILFRQGFRKVVTMLMDMERKNHSDKTFNVKKQSQPHGKGDEKKKQKTINYADDIRDEGVKREMNRIVKRQEILETLKPDLYDNCREYQKVIWKKFKRKFLAVYEQYEELKTKFYLVNPNNLEARREIQSEMDNFPFPRFSWLSPEEIVKQVAIDTVASLRAIEKQQGV